MEQICNGEMVKQKGLIFHYFCSFFQLFHTKNVEKVDITDYAKKLEEMEEMVLRIPF